MNLNQIPPLNLLVFAVLATISVLAAIGVIASKNAVKSALCLVLNFLILAVLYFTLQAETIGILQVVVYTGAIMVLFLFVIMLLSTQGSINLTEHRDVKKIVAGLVGAALATLIGVQVYLPLAGIAAPSFDSPQGAAVAAYGSPEPLGIALFTTYGYPFETASLLLMIGIVGSIMLAKRRVK